MQMQSRHSERLQGVGAFLDFQSHRSAVPRTRQITAGAFPDRRILHHHFFLPTRHDTLILRTITPHLAVHSCLPIVLPFCTTSSDTFQSEAPSFLRHRFDRHPSNP